MGKDKPVCDSKEHLEKAAVATDASKSLWESAMDTIGFGSPKAVDKSLVPCEKAEVQEKKPVLPPEQEAKVKEHVTKLEAAVKNGSLQEVGEYFNKITPRIVGKNYDEFHNSPNVKVANETFDRLNKKLEGYGINFDYRSTGVFSGDKSPSLIISRESSKGANITEHLEVTLQGSPNLKADFKDSDAQRVMIRDFKSPEGTTTDHDIQRVRGTGDKSGAEVAYAQIMKPYTDAQRKK
jgi:hypothetical protein